MPRSYRAVAVSSAPSLVCSKCKKSGHFAKTCPANTFPSPSMENKGKGYATTTEPITVKWDAHTVGHMKRVTVKDSFRSEQRKSDPVSQGVPRDRRMKKGISDTEQEWLEKMRRMYKLLPPV